MCGRARCNYNPSSLLNITKINQEKWFSLNKYQPMNNMLPGMYFPVIYKNNYNEKCINSMKWGLIPSYTSNNVKLDYFKMFNARSETIKSKISFKKLIQNKRCVVYLNGYYEWKLIQGKKQPYYVTTKSNTPLKVAAIYDIFHEDSNDEPLYSFTIITRQADDTLNWLHERQPVFLSDDQIDIWINNNQPLDSSLFPFIEQSHYEVDNEDNNEIENNENDNEDLKEDITNSNESNNINCYVPDDIISFPVTPNMTSPSYQENDSCQPYTPILSKTITSFFNKSKQINKSTTTTTTTTTVSESKEEIESTTINNKSNNNNNNVIDLVSDNEKDLDILDEENHKEKIMTNQNSTTNTTINKTSQKNIQTKETKKRSVQGSVTDYLVQKKKKK